jgi:small subunit ribosomal protein S15
MALTKAEKDQIIGDYKINETDTGSAQVQVAMLTQRINTLVEHLRFHKHDNATERGLLKMVGRRRRLLVYLRETKPAEYEDLIQKLGLRRLR